ncbi:ester cyclase [Haladaptatus caseinilyticus]|uniref:ester cyclase n=1 Tax=Haladaptatus caseinilyticus TaxID=2993314 RepID=UPI00224ABDA5|nr:ester cyclase [Haladaptatus caseinilyticus]
MDTEDNKQFVREFMNIDPTNVETAVPGIGIMRVEDERVVEAWYNYDMLGLLEQVGAVSPPN